MNSVQLVPFLLLATYQSTSTVANPVSSVPVHLEAHDLTVELPAGAGWRSQVDTLIYGYPIDMLIRIDASGLVAVMIDSDFGMDANCRAWSETMLLDQGAKASTAPAVKPEGWHPVLIDTSDGISSKACLDFKGGIITAAFAGQDPDVPESHRRSMATALDAIRLTVARKTPTDPRK